MPHGNRPLDLITAQKPPKYCGGGSGQVEAKGPVDSDGEILVAGTVALKHTFTLFLKISCCSGESQTTPHSAGVPGVPWFPHFSQPIEPMCSAHSLVATRGPFSRAGETGKGVKETASL